MKGVLVTGGNSGIGFECARKLTSSGWQVLIASRNRDASSDAARRITRESGNDTVSAMSLDLGSLESVRRFAHEIEAANVPLGALVCNAGLQVIGGAARRPAHGLELTFALNPLGHFLLTNLLPARLAPHEHARILLVPPRAHAPKIR